MFIRQQFKEIDFKNNLPQQQWTRRDLQLFCERYMQEFT